MAVLSGTRRDFHEPCGKCGEGCTACSWPYPTINFVVEAERVRALPSDVGFRASPKQGRYRFEVVQCKHCGAEALVTYGARVVHWRKTPRFWSGLDERIEARDAKRQRDYDEARERAKRADAAARKREVRLAARLKRDQETDSFLSRLRAARPAARLALLLRMQGRFVKGSRLFEIAMADLFGRQPGYDAEVTGCSRDRGADVVVSRKRRRIFAQCKRWSKKAGRPEVQKLAGVLEEQDAERGLLICTGGFTDEAVQAARKMARRSVLLVDRRGLNLLLTNFAHFAGRYLNRVDVHTAFDDLPAPAMAPPALQVTVGQQRLCQEALRVCPVSPPPAVGRTQAGFQWRRVKGVAGVRCYCLFRRAGQVHSGPCRFEK